MAKGIPQLAAFVNRPRCRRCNMAGHSARKRELRIQLFKPGFVLADVWINLAVSAFEVSISHQCRTAMAWTCNIEHIQVIFLYYPVQMYIDEVLARRRIPVSNYQWFYM